MNILSRITCFIKQSYPKWVLLLFFILASVSIALLLVDKPRQITKLEGQRSMIVERAEGDRRQKIELAQKLQQDFEERCKNEPGNFLCKGDGPYGLPGETATIDQREFSELATLDQKKSYVEQGRYIWYAALFWVSLFMLIPIARLLLLVSITISKKINTTGKKFWRVFRDMNSAHQWIIVLLAFILLAILAI